MTSLLGINACDEKETGTHLEDLFSLLVDSGAAGLHFDSDQLLSNIWQKLKRQSIRQKVFSTPPVKTEKGNKWHRIHRQFCKCL